MRTSKGLGAENANVANAGASNASVANTRASNANVRANARANARAASPIAGAASTSASERRARQKSPDKTAADAASSSAPYARLTPIMCLRLAAPHTWPGPSILTTVFGGLLSITLGFAFSPLIWYLLLATAVLAQSAVNTLNDWSDYRKGVDTIENSDDPTDAVLVYDHPNPTHVLILGAAYLAAFFACGLICMLWSASLVPLLIGIVGALVLLCYSSGKVPISSLPLGEIASGITMGCLIPLADVCVFAGHEFDSGPLGLLGQLDWLELVICTVPFAIGVAMVMATQNACDIERDRSAHRRTLAVFLGRKKALKLYRLFIWIWVAVVAHLAFWLFPRGFWAAIVMLVFALPTIGHMLTTPLSHEARGQSMATVNMANLFINGAYLAAVAMSLILAP